MAAQQRRKLVGGYDCEFVTQPPDAFQTDCPICLQILREPCLISCPCGQKICRECVEQIKEDDKPCPMCNKTDFTHIRDYGLERYLKAQEVSCSHKNDGCEWRGKLGEYEQHLNSNPSQDNQLTG
ncbi:TNF receptor-associated factor 6, partial [Geodia barretti]